MLSESEARHLLLPGVTTAGHYQIEDDCAACHTTEFPTVEDFQKACMSCHEQELERAQDSHPQSKFTDPRNAERVAQLDARYCVACHTEHQPGATSAMGLTLQADYCFRCHQDIGEERPSHDGLGFETCASAGCHNFHDNRALYEDFLLKNAKTPALTDKPLRPVRVGGSPCTSELRDGASVEMTSAACGGCHAIEDKTWKEGRHGMRVARDFEALRPAQGRLPMRTDARQPLTCGSCHAMFRGDGPGPREVGGRRSEVDACLGCHADEHSLAYTDSPHASLWRAEVAGTGATGSGVTCATCHLPRVQGESGKYFVEHNQNANLRPNEKMVRSVCMACHGLGFALDALADSRLINNNFAGQPSSHVASIDWVVQRKRQKKRDSKEK